MTEAWAQLAYEVMTGRGIALPAVAEGNHAAAIDAAFTSGQLRKETVLGAMAEEYGLECIDPLPAVPDRSLKKFISTELAEKKQVLPLALESGVLRVALADPLDVETVDDLGHRLGFPIEAILAEPEALAGAIEAFSGTAEEQERQAVAEETEAADEATPEGFFIEGLEAVAEEEGPIIRLVQRIIAEAIRQRASDIHLEPMEHDFRVRFRIDGRLREIERPPRQLQSAVISRVKLMADLSLAEKRRPQDGRIRVRTDGKDLDFRVSSLPSVFGETIVMRILDKEGLRLGLPELGMFSDDETTFGQLISQPDGIFLVTGPTGSGKSTTLYAALNHLNRPDRKIITVEDPVEYQITGINQVAVRREIGMDFAAALRAMLRQAPNVIMVGEIRDRETAEIAINASLTGHMVFSTLHTNDAPSAISRLIDLGAKPFLVSASLRAAMAQRLVRMICPECKEHFTPDDSELAFLGLTRAELGERQLARGRGCLHCGGSGFHGRKGIFELLAIDEELERMIYERATLVELRSRARDAGMRSMREDGLRKVLAGWTSLAEVLAVTVE